MFNFSCWQVNIVFTKDGIHTLAKVVIVDLMCANLFIQSCTIQRFVDFDVAQTKKMSYCDWHLDQFLFLTIEIFKYLHKKGLFTRLCQHHLRASNNQKALLFFVLVIFFHQKISIALQRKQSFSILSQVVMIGVTISRLSLLQDTAPIAMIHLLQVVDCWDGEFLTLVCANLTSFKYSLDYNTFCTFFESVVCL